MGGGEGEGGRGKREEGIVLLSSYLTLHLTVSHTELRKKRYDFFLRTPFF